LNQPRAGEADLRRIRLYHFLIAAAGGILSPFLTLFYQKQGLNGTEIGWLGATAALVALVAAPIWGRWNDTLHQPRRLLQIGLLGSSICYLVLGQQNLFIWLAVLVGCEALFSAALEPLSYNFTFAVTESRDKAGFGSIRLWGSVGWALAAPLAGWFIERTSLQTIFIGYALINLGSIWVLTSFASIKREPTKTVEVNVEPKQSTRQLVKSLLSNRLMLGLGLALIISWLTSAGRYQFEAIYLNQLGAGEGVIGLVNTVGALIELPAMLWADRLVRRYGSRQVFQGSFLLEAAAMLIVLLWPSVISMFAMRLVAGIAYSLYVIGMTLFIVERSPRGQSTTLLALFSVTLRSLVGLLSGPLSGLAFDALGAYWLFAIALVGCLLTWLMLQVSQMGTSRERTS